MSKSERLGATAVGGRNVAFSSTGDELMLDNVRRALSSRCDWRFWAAAAAGLCGCYALSQSNYLLFHTLVELSTAVVSCAVFIFFWNSRQYLDNGFFLFIAVACLVAGALDLTHALAFQGVSILPDMTGNESLQAKIAGRWIASLSFLIAPLFLRRRINLPLTLTVYGAVLVLTLAAIFRWHVFPACYVPGRGMTAFEHVSRGVNGVTFLAAAALLARKRSCLDTGVFPLLFAALMANAALELLSAELSDFHGPLNVLAHLSQLVSLYLVCQAMLVREPEEAVQPRLHRLEEQPGGTAQRACLYRRDPGNDRRRWWRSWMRKAAWCVSVPAARTSPATPPRNFWAGTSGTA